MSKIDSIFYQSLEFAPDLEFDIRIVRTQADALYRGFGRYDLHYHSNWEIDFVIEGEGENIFQNRVYSFEPGDIYIIEPYKMHNSYTTSEIQLFCMQFNLDSVIKTVLMSSDLSSDLTKSNLHFCERIQANDSHYTAIRTIIEQVLDEWKHKPIAWHSAVRLYLAQLFIALVRYFPAPAAEDDQTLHSENLSIREALDYINSNYTKQIRLEQVAKHAIVHKNYFCFLFKKHVGCTYYSYLNMLRLKHACTLLLSTEQTIKEIALNSGFLDISTFNKAFKKAFALTPSEYKRQATHFK